MNTLDGVQIELHSDDFGQTINTTKDILALMKEGCLDGISILPNMPCSKECLDMLREALKNKELPFLPRISVHLDLVEGKKLTSEGYIPWNWKKLFFASYPVINKSTYKLVKEEVRAQLLAGRAYTDELQTLAKENGVEYVPQKLRIDSHQHAHMLPIVWKAVKSVIAEEGLEVEYIRNSHEPLGVFLRNRSGYKWSPVGILKNRILAVMAHRIEKWTSDNGIKQMYLWGLIMTGHMDIDRIDALLDGMILFCKKQNRNLELNIHPGLMLESEMCEEIPEESARDFYMVTDNRRLEADTVRRFSELFINR